MTNLSQRLKNDPSSSLKLNPNDCLKRSKRQLSKSCLLCTTSLLSIAVALSTTSVQADEQLLTSDNSEIENDTSLDQEFIHPARTLKQARFLIEPPTAIAQTDTPTAQPSAPATQPARGNAAAQTASDRWQFSAAPYFFVPFNVRTDATVVGRSTSFRLGLGDILSLDRAFDAGLRVEARKNRLGLIFDGFYVSAKDSESLGVTFPQGSLQRFGINFPVRASTDATLSVRQGTVDLAASYRVVDTSLTRPATAPNPYPRLTVDPIAGLRLNILRQKLEVGNIRLNNIPVGALPLPISLPVNEEYRFSRTFVEPLIGAQIGVDLSDRWSAAIRGDVSGFNINADRNLTWNLLTSVQYNLSPSTSLQLGYRFNNFEFEDGSGLRRAKVNVRQNGLILGVIFRF